MNSRTAQYASRLIESGWLAAVITVPVFFDVWSNRVFEPDKLTLLRSIALLMLAAAIVRVIEVGLPGTSDLRRWLRLPLVAPLLALTAVIAFSSFVSWVPRLSIAGSYTRLQGLYTWLAYVTVFFCVLALLRRREQLDRLIMALILPSLPVALYGIVQKFGLDPMPWLGDVTFRVASTMGNSIFVSAYLIMVVPLTISRLTAALRALEEDEGSASVLRVSGYLVLLAVQIMAIVFAQSRGPFVGFIGGVALLLLLMAAIWARRDMVLVILGLSVVVGAFLIVFNIPGSPLAPLRDTPYVGRMGRIFETDRGTGKVRVLIWEGALELVRDDPVRMLVGYGPESMHIAYNRFYPPELAHYESRNASPDRSHNETLDVLVQTGLLGFVAYLMFFTGLFYYGLKWLGLISDAVQRNMFLAFWFGGGVLSVLGFLLWSGDATFFGVALPAGLVAGLFGYVALRTLRGWSMGERPGGLLMAGLVAALYAHFIEIHFGIAIAATRTLFFAMAGALVVMGALAADRPKLLSIPDLSAASPTVKRKRSRRRPHASAPKPSEMAWTAAAFLTLTVLVVLGYDLLVNVSTSDSTYWLVLTWIIGLAWFIGTLVLGTEILVLPGASWSGFVRYLAITIGGFFAYAVLHASVLAAGMQGRGGPDTSSNLLILFYMFMLVLLMGWAWALVRLDPSPATYANRKWAWLYPVLILVALGMALFTNVNEVRADIYYKQAYVRYHSDAAALQAEGNWEQASAYYEYAERYYDRALALDPTEDYYLLFKGKVLLEKADGLAGLLEEQLASALGPDTVEGSGFSEYELEDSNPDLDVAVTERDRAFEAALQVLDRALDAAPKNTDHYANLGRAYQVWGDRTFDAEKRSERLDKSREWFEQATVLSPHNAQLHEELGTTEYLAGDRDEALREIERALEIDPEYGRPYKIRATVYREEGEWEKAEADYRHYVESRDGRRDSFGWSALAFVLGQQNKLEEALEANQKVLDIVGPDDLPTLRNLAIIARDMDDRQAACEYAMRGLNVARDDGGLLALWTELDCASAGADALAAPDGATPEPPSSDEDAESEDTFGPQAPEPSEASDD